jgi:hypothetical protein
MQLPDVADQIAEWEYGSPAHNLTEEALDAYTSLYHSHIPKLADADVVAYDQSEDMVELARNASLLRPHLEQTVKTDLETTDKDPI